MWQVFSFESRYQLRSPLFAVVAVVFFLLGFLATASESVQVGEGGGNLNLNAAYSIVQTQYVLSIIGMFAAVAFVAGAITRDHELKTAEILFSTGVGERSYLAGRFLGGWLFATLAVGSGIAGTLLGTLMPWIDQERVGAFAAEPYLFSVWAVLVPNMFVVCALFFCVSALTRSMMAAYVTALGFMVTFAILAAATDPDRLGWLALTDPFGLTAFQEVTRYWTVFDRNVRVPEFAGTLLYNRLIWCSAGLLALLATAARFRFALGARQRRWRLPRLRRARPMAAPPQAESLPAVAPAAGFRADLVRLWSQLCMDVRGVVRSVPFYVLLAFGIFNVVGAFIGAISQLYGTPVLPVTPLMIQVVDGAFLFVVVIVIVYYSGELVHRERQHGVADIIDATPYPSGIMVLSKVGALWFVITALLLVVMLTSMVVQVANGYYRLEPGLYLVGLFGVLGFWFYLWCVPAVLVQVFAPGKFLGMLIFLLAFLAVQTLPSLGFEHYLYRLGAPRAAYSAMNGYGHFIEPLVTFGAYWLCFALLLMILAHLWFPRGAGGSWRARVRVARGRFTLGLRAATGILVLTFAGLGGWIYYNTNVLNEYLTEDDRELAQADYEKQYRSNARLPMPEVLDIDTEIDLFPRERRLESRGRAVLVNDQDSAIDEVHFTVAPALTINTLELDGGSLQEADERLGYYQYRLAEPLQPGQQRALRWDFTWRNPGFENSGSTTRVVETFR